MVEPCSPSRQALSIGRNTARGCDGGAAAMTGEIPDGVAAQETLTSVDLLWQVRHGHKAEGSNTDALEEAVSLAQHHDAVTGTAKQHVADDYNMRIAAGARSWQTSTAAARACMQSRSLTCYCFRDNDFQDNWFINT